MNINLVANVFIEYDNVMAAFVTNSVYLIELTVSKKKNSCTEYITHFGQCKVQNSDSMYYFLKETYYRNLYFEIILSKIILLEKDFFQDLKQKNKIYKIRKKCIS